MKRGFHSSGQKLSNDKKPTFRTICPLCGAKLTLQGFETHRKKEHNYLTHKEFEMLVIDAIKSGKVQAQYFEGSNGSLSSGTQKTNKAHDKDQGGLFHQKQGGRVSPK